MGVILVQEGKDCATQKPAAHFCGGVLSATIHVEQSTVVDRTSQVDLEFVLRSHAQSGHSPW
jgi:hypothetical protein